MYYVFHCSLVNPLSPQVLPYITTLSMLSINTAVPPSQSVLVRKMQQDVLYSLERSHWQTNGTSKATEPASTDGGLQGWQTPHINN